MSEIEKARYLGTAHPRMIQPERRTICHVGNLQEALDAYWNAKTHREDQAAYHEILLFGGIDGYANYGSIRTTVARWLRKAALWMDGL
jgi:hypothetical protein